MGAITVPRSAYRPDIDALRAVAVLAVVLFHVEAPFFQGGFVGVDVFFVISGYLITRLLQAEIAATGRLDLWAFYLRRIRRLLPAMVATTGLTAVAAMVVLTPERLRSFGAALLHSQLSLSNFYFYLNSGYFDPTAGTNALLHTWSLSVEEQFYLLWPLILLVVGRRATLATVCMAGLGIVSLAGAQWAVAASPQAAFFLMPFRVFEFACGAALVGMRQWPSESRHVANAVYVGGLVLIAGPIGFYSEHTAFPGVAALVPCVGTMCCLVSAERASVARAVAVRPVLVVGVVSYSLYLVHWPIVVLYRYLSSAVRFSPWESAELLLASLALAGLMYWAVEQRFRRLQSDNRPFLLMAVCAVVLLSYAGASMWALTGWEWRPWMVTRLSTADIASGKDRRFDVLRDVCSRKGWDNCGEPVAGSVNVLIMGDSHAPDALNGLHALFPQADYSISTLGGCPPHIDIESITPPTHPDRAACVQLNRQRFDVAYLKRFDVVVLNVLLGWYTENHLTSYLRFLHHSGISRVVVLGGYYALQVPLPELVNRFGYSASVIRNAADDRSLGDGSVKAVADELGYQFISKREAFCRGSECEFMDSAGVPFTYDEHHLSVEFARRMFAHYREPLAPLMSSATNRSVDSRAVNPMQVTDWGPRRTAVGVVPNVQPDGDMGVWVRLSSPPCQSHPNLSVAGVPARIVVFSEDLLTAAVPPIVVMTPGEKHVRVSCDLPQSTYLVGTLTVE